MFRAIQTPSGLRRNLCVLLLLLTLSSRQPAPFVALYPTFSLNFPSTHRIVRNNPTTSLIRPPSRRFSVVFRRERRLPPRGESNLPRSRSICPREMTPCVSCSAASTNYSPPKPLRYLLPSSLFRVVARLLNVNLSPFNVPSDGATPPLFKSSRSRPTPSPGQRLRYLYTARRCPAGNNTVRLHSESPHQNLTTFHSTVSPSRRSRDIARPTAPDHLALSVTRQIIHPFMLVVRY